MMAGVRETRFWLVRHAPVPSPQGHIPGQLDVACDLSDEDDLRQLALRLPQGAVLVESGLRRCRQTSEALAGIGLPLPDPRIEPDLMEQHFGAWQGKSWIEIEAEKDPALERFWADPAGTAPPGGESFADLCARVGAALDRLADHYPGRDVVMVVHAGSIRAAVAHALALAPSQALQLAIRPLSLTRLDCTAGGWMVDCMNVTAA